MRSGTAGSQKKMVLQPWGIYVNGKSGQQDAAWDFLKFLSNQANNLLLTTMTGWVAARQDVDWKPLLAKIPQFEVFVSTPKDVEFYVEPVLAPWDEIETRLADQLPVLALFAYVRVVRIGFSVLLSFYKWKLISPLKPFIGLENYRQLMADDNFILALKNTTIYSLSTVIISIVLALPLAVFLAG